LRPTAPPAEVNPRDHFDPDAWSRVYDPAVHAAGYAALRCVSRAAADLAASWYGPDERWLDIGCGLGRVVAEWTELDRDIIGVDHDSRMLAHARSVTRPSASPGRFVAASAYQLPFPDGSVDGALASLLTGCLAFPEQFFAELRRVVRPSGRAVLTFTSAHALSLWFLGWLRRLRLLPPIDPVTGGVFRRYRRDEVAQLLATAEFVVERLEFVNCIPPRANAWWPGSGRERLCRHFIVVARRL